MEASDNIEQAIRKSRRIRNKQQRERRKGLAAENQRLREINQMLWMRLEILRLYAAANPPRRAPRRLQKNIPNQSINT